MVISVSTCSRRTRMPSIAVRMRRGPSNPNGRVTIPTVRIPRLLGQRCHDRSRSGPGSAAHSSSDEDHVDVVEHGLYLTLTLCGGFGPDRRFRPGTQAARDVCTDLDLVRSGVCVERLRVGIDRNKLDAVNAPVSPCC